MTERFWSKVDRTASCWNWTASRDRKGYGRFMLNGTPVLAHRLSWFMEHGEPGKMCVLHLCDNPRCVRPSHLFLGTIQDNNADMISKGRRRPDVKFAICARGHERSGYNLKRDGSCRKCKILMRQKLRENPAHVARERALERARYARRTGGES